MKSGPLDSARTSSKRFSGSGPRSGRTRSSLPSSSDRIDATSVDAFRSASYTAESRRGCESSRSCTSVDVLGIGEREAKATAPRPITPVSSSRLRYAGERKAK